MSRTFKVWFATNSEEFAEEEVMVFDCGQETHKDAAETFCEHHYNPPIRKRDLDVCVRDEDGVLKRVTVNVSFRPVYSAGF